MTSADGAGAGDDDEVEQCMLLIGFWLYISCGVIYKNDNSIILQVL